MSVLWRCDSSPSRQSLYPTVRSCTQAMQRMNQRMNIPALQAIMREFEMQARGRLAESRNDALRMGELLMNIMSQCLPLCCKV